MTPEPQKQFPRVSSCHRANLGVGSSKEGTNYYFCVKCAYPCDAIADEGLGEKKCKGCNGQGFIWKSGKGLEPNTQAACSWCNSKPLPPPDAKEEKGEKIKAWYYCIPTPVQREKYPYWTGIIMELEDGRCFRQCSTDSIQPYSLIKSDEK